MTTSKILRGAHVALFLCLLPGCAVHVGVAVHPEQISEPEYYAPNPLGVVRGERDFSKRWRGYCEHLSAIPYTEAGGGLNSCGITYKINR